MPEDPQASLRAELLDKLDDAAASINAALADLRHAGDASAIAQNEANLSGLIYLKATVSIASPVALVAMRAAISGAIATATTTAEQSRSATASAGGAALAGAAAESRSALQSTMQAVDRFELHFDSAEDQEAYRQRRAVRGAYIGAELAKHTPQGNLNAAGGTIGQMVDAKAHGAGNDPAFQEQWDRLVTTTEKLRDEVRKSGGLTKEFDDRLRADLRRILKAKGLTDAQVDVQFATHHDDPLETAKAFVTDNDLGEITRSVNQIGAMNTKPAPTIVVASKPAMELTVADAMAEFRTAGITASDHPASDGFVHGVKTQERPAPALSRTTVV